MSATNDPNSVEFWRRACRRWQLVALFSAAALAVVAVSLGALLYGESAAKCDAWEQAREARKSLQAAEEAFAQERRGFRGFGEPQGRELDLLAVMKKLVVRERQEERERGLLRLLQVGFAPESARPILELRLWDELKARQE